MIGEGTMTRTEQAQAESEEIRINRRQAADAIIAHLTDLIEATEDAYRNPRKNALRLHVNGRGELVADRMTSEIADLLEMK